MTEESDILRISTNEAKIIADTLGEYTREGTFVFSFSGSIRKEDVDGLSKAADILLQIEGVETVLVVALVPKHLVGRFKTSSGAIDASSWIKSLFPNTNPEEKKDSDAVISFEDKNNVDFTIPLGLIGRAKDKLQLLNLTETLIRNLFLDKVGKVAENS